MSIGAATGGVFALLLAVRRQWHQERSAAATELDATEKRVTELYTKAVEQLGSENAPVRLAALYALERVAQNNPDQRQTVVDVLCAYLRMPYPLEGVGDVERQEREVRLTAQRLLITHLRLWPRRLPQTYWAGMDIDLTGAVLIDFTMNFCNLEGATFHETKFVGDVDFASTRFSGARFGRLELDGPISFWGARFGYASFSEVEFNAADFTGVVFEDGVDFERVEFHQVATFDDARLGYPTFRDVRFHEATFSGIEFAEARNLYNVEFAQGVPKEAARLFPPRSRRED